MNRLRDALEAVPSSGGLTGTFRGHRRSGEEEHATLWKFSLYGQGDIEPVHVLHVHVQEQEVRPPSDGCCNCACTAVFVSRFKPGMVQDERESLRDQTIVVADKNFHASTGRCREELHVRECTVRDRLHPE